MMDRGPADGIRDSGSAAVNRSGCHRAAEPRPKTNEQLFFIIKIFLMENQDLAHQQCKQLYRKPREEGWS
jgi:hypothetical protein